MTEWLLVRHGETSWNSEGRVQGQTATSLNEKGLRQAEALRIRLAERKIQAVYASDLPRVVETARVILQGRYIPLFLCPELRELSYGRWEGLTYTEVQAQDPMRYREFLQGDPSFVPPQGESIQSLMLRISRFASQVKATHPQGTLLIVGHGGSLRALLLCLLELPVSAFWRLRLDPGSLSLVEVYSEGAVLGLLNDVSHCGEGR
jgi:broad specificity phosphatase PhoE